MSILNGLYDWTQLKVGSHLWETAGIPGGFGRTLTSLVFPKIQAAILTIGNKSHFTLLQLKVKTGE